MTADTARPVEPADPEDIKQALSFALRFSGRKRIHDVDKVLAYIAAERLVEHLRMSGFVVMKVPLATPWEKPT